MFIMLKLANGDEVVVNRDRIDSIEKSDEDPTAFEVHVGTRHYVIDSAEYVRLTSEVTASFRAA